MDLTPNQWAELGINGILGLIVLAGIVYGVRPLVSLLTSMMANITSEGKATRQAIEEMTKQYGKNIETEKGTALEISNLTKAINASVTQNNGLNETLRSFENRVALETKTQLTAFFSGWQPVIDSWNNISENLKTTMDKLNNTLESRDTIAKEALDQSRANGIILQQLVTVMKERQGNTDRISQIEIQLERIMEEKKVDEH